MQCNLLQILERLIFNVAEKSLVLEIFFSGYPLIKGSRKMSTYSWNSLTQSNKPHPASHPCCQGFALFAKRVNFH